MGDAKEEFKWAKREAQHALFLARREIDLFRDELKRKGAGDK